MNKDKKYIEVLNIAKSLLSKDCQSLSNMANLCALLKEKFDFHWVGFYLVNEKNNSLYLGPFQGPLACTDIPFGKGVCGQAWSQNKILNVPDVHKFVGHIACSSLSNSEIVIPVVSANKVIAVLDIDSIEFNAFDKMDERYLAELISFI